MDSFKIKYSTLSGSRAKATKCTKGTSSGKAAANLAPHCGNDMRREKPIRIEIREDATGAKLIVRSYADGRIEHEPILPKVAAPKRHILGVRKLSLDKTRKKSF